MERSKQTKGTRETSPGVTEAPSLEELAAPSRAALTTASLGVPPDLTATFVATVRAKLFPSGGRGPWEAAPNVVDKFFRLKQELRSVGKESSVYSDHRVMGMFLSSQFFPDGVWQNLSSAERNQTIESGLRELEADFARFRKELHGRRRR